MHREKTPLKLLQNHHFVWGINVRGLLVTHEIMPPTNVSQSNELSRIVMQQISNQGDYVPVNQQNILTIQEHWLPQPRMIPQ